MKEKDLRNLTRRELLEMLISQTKELDRVKGELQDAQEVLRQRRILLAESGSIAEAALKLNKVFETAQEAANQYLDSIRLSGDGALPSTYFPEPNADAQALLEQARRDCETMRSRTEAECDAMRAAAKRECQEMRSFAQASQDSSELDALRIQVEQECEAMREKTRQECQKMMEEAEDHHRQLEFDALLKELHIED